MVVSSEAEVEEVVVEAGDHLELLVEVAVVEELELLFLHPFVLLRCELLELD